MRSDLQQEALHITKGTGQITKYNWPIVHPFKMFPCVQQNSKAQRGKLHICFGFKHKRKEEDGSGDSSCRVWLWGEQQSGNNKMSQSARKTGGFGYEPFWFRALISGGARPQADEARLAGADTAVQLSVTTLMITSSVNTPASLAIVEQPNWLLHKRYMKVRWLHVWQTCMRRINESVVVGEAYERLPGEIRKSSLKLNRPAWPARARGQRALHRCDLQVITVTSTFAPRSLPNRRMSRDHRPKL